MDAACHGNITNNVLMLMHFSHSLATRTSQNMLEGTKHVLNMYLDVENGTRWMFRLGVTVSRRTNLAKGINNCSTVEHTDLTQDKVVGDVETTGWG